MDGDTIEVKLRDSSYCPFFSEKAKVQDKRQMIRLINRLEDLGVFLPSRQERDVYKEEWFDD